MEGAPDPMIRVQINLLVCTIKNIPHVLGSETCWTFLVQTSKLFLTRLSFGWCSFHWFMLSMQLATRTDREVTLPSWDKESGN